MAHQIVDRTMRTALTSLFVDDQPAAPAFYTEVLGFTKRHDVPLGDNFWLTVVSPE
jgi:catechol 2,3-dioxygenase-like lactoylglutathione lyase family enzyme